MRERFVIVLMSLASLAGIAVFFFGLHMKGEMDEKDASYVETTGRVVEYNGARTEDGRTIYTSVVEYEVNGTEYRVTKDIFTSRKEKLGKTHKVMYHPQKPYDSYIKSGMREHWVIILAGILFAVVPIIVMISVLSEEKRTRSVGTSVVAEKRTQSVGTSVVAEKAADFYENNKEEVDMILDIVDTKVVPAARKVTSVAGKVENGIQLAARIFICALFVGVGSVVILQAEGMDIFFIGILLCMMLCVVWGTIGNIIIRYFDKTGIVKSIYLFVLLFFFGGFILSLLAGMGQSYHPVQNPRTLIGYGYMAVMAVLGVRKAVRRYAEGNK